MLNGSTSKDETINFINDYAAYIYNKAGLNLDDYKLIFHTDKSIAHENISAWMCPASKFLDNFGYAKKGVKITEFDIYFNPGDLRLTNLTFLYDFVEFLQTVGHEIWHTIQYIKKPNVMENFNIELDNLKTLKLLVKNFKTRKLINKKIEIQDFCNKTEKEADAKSYALLTTMLVEICQIKIEEKFINFINQILFDVEKSQNCREAEYKSRNKVWKKERKRVEKALNNPDLYYPIIFEKD